MGWINNDTELIVPIGDQDLAKAAGYSTAGPNDGPWLIANGLFAKFAKWHPVPGQALSLTTREARQKAGRADSADVTYQYGVHATGFGMSIALSDIHTCNFEYLQPQIGVDMLRLDDFGDPEDPTIGYVPSAHFDFSGQIYNNTGNPVIIPTGEPVLPYALYVRYSAFTAWEAARMISVLDFLHSDSPIGPTFTPSAMYPCALITQTINGVVYHFVHCLYPTYGQQQLTTLGSQTDWQLPLTGIPIGTGAGQLHPNESATISLFLSSAQYLINGDPSTNIANWVVLDEIGSAQQLWTAWFCPVPDACGVPCIVGSAPSPDPIITITGADYDANFTRVRVYYSVINPTLTTDYTMNAYCDGYGPLNTPLLISAGQTSGQAFFSLNDFRALGVLYVNGWTNAYRFQVMKNGSSHGSEYPATLTYGGN